MIISLPENLRPTGRIKPVYKEIFADLETPLTAYLKVASHPSFLLESVEQGERVARYSFIGTGQRRRLEAHGTSVRVTSAAGTESFVAEDPLRVLWEMTVQACQQDDALPDFWAGMVGYAAYDLIRVYEKLPDSNPDELGIPDLLFIEPEVLIIFDHLKRRMFLVATAEVDNQADEARAQQAIDTAYASLRGPLPGVPGDRAGRHVDFVPNMSKEAYMDIVAKTVDYIHAGDIFQCVPSQRLSAELGVHPFALYRALRAINPSPYLGYLDLGPVTLVSSSPESLVRSDGVRVETLPIAGTRRRGQNDAEDLALAEELLADAKERAEHIMLVDLGRNDLGRVCAYGSVHVADLMRIERYSHVMHIVSTVEGKLAAGKTPLDALASTLPMGTASGAPKIRAMEIIDGLEPTRRGPYAGAFGYVSVTGAMDMALTLRTAVITGGKIHLQAGGGVVADSDPEFEYNESMNKLAALVRAVELATKGLA